MVAVAIGALLVGLAVPALTRFVQNSRETTEADALMTSLSYARSEAIKSDADVKVCVSSDGATCSSSTAWGDGWIVLASSTQSGGSSTLLQAMPQLADGNTLKAVFNGDSVNQVTFQPDGMVLAAAQNQEFSQTYFTLCDSRGGQFARDVEVSPMGAIHASSTPGYNLDNPPLALSCP